MSLPTILIYGGWSVERYIEIGDDKQNLGRLIDAGIIREATQADLDNLAAKERISYRHGGAYGSGAYVIESADQIFVMQDGFNLGHLDLAIRRMMDQQRQAKLDDLYTRLDSVS